jgi:hypothetical protein
MSITFNTVKKFVEYDDRVSFGKYINLHWLDVIATDPDYLIWCVGNLDMQFHPDMVIAAIKNKYQIKKQVKEAYNTSQSKNTYTEWFNDWGDDVPF